MYKKLSLLLLTIIFLIATTIEASARITAKTLACSDKKARKIWVPPGKAVILQFAVKPTDSIPGKPNFDLKYIKNDIAIKAKYSGAISNLFVYLPHRVCWFELVTVKSGGDQMIHVVEPFEKTFEAEYVE